MKMLWRCGAAVLVLVLAGCEGELPSDDDNPYRPSCASEPDNPNCDPNGPCTDPSKCCPKDKMKCYGDPDKGVVCTCSDLWDCSKNPNKCEQDVPTPDGSTGWECTWTEFKYECKKKGSKDQPPTGGSEWSCKWNDVEFSWVCTRATIPNPTNSPSGVGTWKCTVDKASGKLVCTRSGGTTQPPGTGVWKCTPDGKTCTKQDDNGGLPPGGSNWKCHKIIKNGVPTWVCYGTSSGGTPPGGSGWTCTKVDEFGTWKCERPEGSGDYPPGGGYYSCVKGTEFGGTKCEKVSTPPQPPGPTPTPGSKCLISDRMWCDGMTYCGWGQVECDPATGTWKTVTKNGKVLLDCQESLANGKVPNTVCACYHYFFNPSCCERSDCIVPKGTSGQVCPASKGGLCDYCNPMKPECKEANAKCIVTNAHETFCGRDCSSAACPTGYTCMTIKLKVTTAKQCVPSDFSCYY